jgi:hypothetical protein
LRRCTTLLYGREMVTDDALHEATQANATTAARYLAIGRRNLHTTFMVGVPNVGNHLLQPADHDCLHTAPIPGCRRLHCLVCLLCPWLRFLPTNTPVSAQSSAYKAFTSCAVRARSKMQTSSIEPLNGLALSIVSLPRDNFLDTKRKLLLCVDVSWKTPST